MPHLGGHVDQAADLLAKTKKPDEEVDLEQFRMGLKVEEEHGPTMHPDLDVTGGDPSKTAKITLVHLREDPAYYTFLAEMEEQGKIRMVQKIVEEGGGEFVGMQDRTVLSKPPLVLFLDPQTKTTLLVDPLQMEVTPETVRQRIQQSRAQFAAAAGG